MERAYQQFRTAQLVAAREGVKPRQTLHALGLLHREKYMKTKAEENNELRELGYTQGHRTVIHDPSDIQTLTATFLDFEDKYKDVVERNDKENEWLTEKGITRETMNRWKRDNYQHCMFKQKAMPEVQMWK